MLAGGVAIAVRLAEAAVYAGLTVAIAVAALGARVRAVAPGAATTARTSLVGGAIGLDGFGVFLTVVICAAVILAALLSTTTCDARTSRAPSSTPC